MSDPELIRTVLNDYSRTQLSGYHQLKALNLEFQDATGWQDLYGEFFYYVSNTITGRHPDLLDRCGGWKNLDDLHHKLVCLTKAALENI